MSTTHLVMALEETRAMIDDVSKDPRSEGHPRRWAKESAYKSGLQIREAILTEAVDLVNKE